MAAVASYVTPEPRRELHRNCAGSLALLMGAKAGTRIGIMLCGVALLPAPAAAREAPCGPAGTTFLRTASTRVFQVARTKPHRSSQVYACARGSDPLRLALRAGPAPHRVARLLNPAVRGQPYDARLAERFVAYRLTWIPFHDGRQGVTNGLVVRSLDTGAVIFRVGSFTSDSSRFLNIDSFVLAASGALAWIQDVASGAEAGRRLVAVDSAGRRTLDSGLNIDAASLRLSGGTLSWTSHGQRRTATLN